MFFINPKTLIRTKATGYFLRVRANRALCCVGWDGLASQLASNQEITTCHYCDILAPPHRTNNNDTWFEAHFENVKTEAFDESRAVVRAVRAEAEGGERKEAGTGGIETGMQERRPTLGGIVQSPSDEGRRADGFGSTIKRARIQPQVKI